MKINKRKAIIIIGILCIIFIVQKLVIVINDNQKKAERIEYLETFQQYGKGIVLGLSNTEEESIDGFITLNSFSDTLEVEFGNMAENKTEYVLKILWDYKEIEFQVENGQPCTEYYFEADAREGMIFPINLCDIKEDKCAHILTLSIFKRPNEHAVDLQFMSNWYGASIDYEIVLEEGERSFENEAEVIDAEEYVPTTCQGIVLNTDFDITDDKKEEINLPDYSVVVKAGETVKIAYRVGNYEDTDNVGLILLTGWKQQECNNTGFLRIKNKEGYLGYGTMEFTAPKEAGKYEMVGILVRYPYQNKDRETYISNSTSYRFSLIVE